MTEDKKQNSGNSSQVFKDGGKNLPSTKPRTPMPPVKPPKPAKSEK